MKRKVSSTNIFSKNLREKSFFTKIYLCLGRPQGEKHLLHLVTDIGIARIFTARKQSLRRLCFHRCVSVHKGGVRGGGKACMVGSGGVCGRGGVHGGGMCGRGGIARTRPESLLFELCPLAREGSILRGAMLISDF